MLNVIKAIIGCIFIPVIILVMGPRAIVSAYERGVPEQVLAALLGSLPIAAMILLLRSKHAPREAHTNSSSTARYFTQMTSAMAEAGRPKTAPIFIHMLLGVTLVTQWMYLAYRTASSIDVMDIAACAALGVAGMSGVAIWNLGRIVRSELGYRLVLPKAPWQVVVICVAGLALILFEAFAKHAFFPTIVLLLMFDLILVRLMVVLGKTLKRPTR
jgi:hypothetical protein